MKNEEKKAREKNVYTTFTFVIMRSVVLVAALSPAKIMEIEMETAVRNNVIRT